MRDMQSRFVQLDMASYHILLKYYREQITLSMLSTRRHHRHSCIGSCPCTLPKTCTFVDVVLRRSDLYMRVHRRCVTV